MQVFIQYEFHFQAIDVESPNIIGQYVDGFYFLVHLPKFK